MKKIAMKRSLAMLLAVVMVVGMLPISAFAAALNLPASIAVVSDEESTLAPGVKLNEIVLYDADGNRNEVFITTTDLSVDTVSVHANYMNNQNQILGMSKLSDQVAAAESKHEEPYTVIAAINGSFYNMVSGAPGGANVMEGVLGPSDPDRPANQRPFFAIVENADGSTSAVIGNSGEWDDFYATHKVLEAIGGERHLVDAGALYQGGGGDFAARQAIGLTADGKLITLTVDGSRAPNSVGMTLDQLGEILLSLGCVEGLLLDGGGSTTLGARTEGSDTFAIINTPCDGAERAISNSLMIVSTAQADGTFDRASLSAEYDYVTPESKVNVTAVGVDAAGGYAEIPDDAVWALKDGDMGTVENGVFISNGTIGDAVVQMKVNGQVVGETTIHVVIPEIAFRQSTLVFPYGTQAMLEVVPTTNDGLNIVTLKAGDVTFSLSNPDMGTLDGEKFTVCDASAGVTEGTITATLAYGTNVTATASVVFGRGSEIIYDFEEDAILSGIVVESAYLHEDMFGRYEKASMQLVTAETGKVRNGNHALAVTCNYSDITSAGPYGVKLDFPDIDLTDATAVGMWLYFTVDDLEGFMLEFCYGNGKADRFRLIEHTVGAEGSGMYEDGWYYISLDLADINLTELRFVRFYAQDINASIYNPYNEFTIYVDDITVDYSAAVADREPPAFSDVLLLDTVGGDVALNGQVVTGNAISVMAKAEENTANINHTGIDSTSAVVYVDGVALTQGFSCSNGVIMIENLALPDGYHTIRFEIADYAGNYTAVERAVVINSKQSDVYLIPANPEANMVAIGSVQWFNLVAKNIDKIETVTIVIDIDNLSQWELEGMEVAYGFEVTYSIEAATNTATIEVSRTDKVEAAGEAILLSLPVRTREWTAYKNQLYIEEGRVTDDETMGDDIYVLTPHAMWYADASVLTRMVVELQTGIVEYVDNATSTFASEKIFVRTECNRWRASSMILPNGTLVNTNATEGRQDKWSWHIHTPGVATDKQATCTEAGYEGRVFCVGCSCGTVENLGHECDNHNGCGSVIDWGTVIPARGHNYAVVGGLAACVDDECGKRLTGELEGKLYANGIPVQGWVNDTYYYVNGEKLTGICTLEGIYYNFGEDGVSQGKITGLFVDPISGKYRYAILGEMKTEWVLVDDAWHYFDENGDAVSGKVENFFPGVTYEFEEDGKLVSGVWVKMTEGTRYYYGPDFYKPTHSSSYALFAWYTIDGNEYCFDKNGYRLEGIRWVTESNDRDRLWYDFGEDGIAVPLGTGFITIDGKIYFVENGVSYYNRGMFEYEGEYYYANSLFEIVTGQYHVVNPNGLVPSTGLYEFDETGKWIKNGVVYYAGNLHYLVDGVPTAAGLFFDEEDGCYYYARTGGKIALGEYPIYADRTNGLLPAGTYNFGTDGKLTFADGMHNLTAGLYYFKNNAPFAAGLIYAEDGFIFFGENGKAVTGQADITGKTNGLLPAGTYDFGTDGKLTFADGMHNLTAGLYYFKDNAPFAAGLIYDATEGCYYYFRTSGQAATGTYTIYASRCNGLLPGGTYDFGEDGKLFISTEEKNGLVQEQDGLYYYVDGVLAHVGLIYDETEGCYYYIRTTGQAATGVYTIYTSRCNGLLPAGTYDFGTDGKLFIEPVNGIVQESDGLYYYVDGIPTHAGLVYDETEGCYYYFRTSGKAATGVYTIYASRCNGLLPAGTYDFGADGKLFIGSEMKNGLVEEYGALYYYVDGVRTHAGLIYDETEGCYYYIRTNGQAATGVYTIYASRCNALLPPGTYDFGTDGKLFIDIPSITAE